MNQRASSLRRGSGRYLPWLEVLEDRIYPGDALGAGIALRQLVPERAATGVDPFAPSFTLLQSPSGRPRIGPAAAVDVGLVWLGGFRALAAQRAEDIGFSIRASGMSDGKTRPSPHFVAGTIAAPGGEPHGLFEDVLPTAEELFDAGFGQQPRRVTPPGTAGDDLKPALSSDSSGFFSPLSTGGDWAQSAPLSGLAAMPGDELFFALNAGLGAGTDLAGNFSTGTPPGGKDGGSTRGNDDSELSDVDFTAVPCTSLTAPGWQVVESGGSTGLRGGVTEVVHSPNRPQCDFEMREGDSHVVSLQRTFLLKGPSVDFWYSDLSFDTSPPPAGTPLRMRDAFEAALVDLQGRPLTHTVGTGRDAFFNLTEGVSGTPFVPGVQHDAVLMHVNVDVSEMYNPAQPQEVRLIIRLVNNDGDTGTRIHVIGGHQNLVFRVPGNTLPAPGPNPTLKFDLTYIDAGISTELWA